MIDARTVVKRIRPARRINGVLPMVWDVSTRTPVTFDMFVERFGMSYVRYVTRRQS